MAFTNLFDTPWCVEKDTQASILLHDWSQMDPVIPEINFGITFSPSYCPICNKILNTSQAEFLALVSGDDNYSFLQPCKKKLFNHCKKHHSEIVFWACIEAPSKVKGDTTTPHFLVQKLIFSASKKYALTNLKDFKVYLAIIFGIAIGSIPEEKSKKLKIGIPAEERNVFFDLVESKLKEVLELCLVFDWDTFFSMFPNKFIALNFLKIFFRKGLFLNPVFPAFKSMVVNNASDPSTDDFSQQEDLLNASVVGSFEADMELDEENVSDDQSCLSFLVPLPLDAREEMDEEVASGFEMDEEVAAGFEMDEEVAAEDHLAFTDDKLEDIYTIMYEENEEVSHSLEGTYGEIDLDGVKKLINGIQENFLNAMDDQCCKNFRVLDVGGGLMTTMIHFAQKIKGFYCGIESCPVRSYLFASSFKKVLAEDLLVNRKIAYFWKDVKYFKIFDFDLLYTFDECFCLADWHHMMSVFKISPRCKFLISFKNLKPQAGQKESLESMIENYGLENLQNIEVKMKVSGEDCIAGFFVKKSFLNNELMDATNYSINDVNPEWSAVKPFWGEEDYSNKLDQMIWNLEHHLNFAKGQRKYRKSNRINFVGLDKTDQEGYEGEDEAYIYETDMDDDEDDLDS
jgi:hypothetical protein